MFSMVFPLGNKVRVTHSSSNCLTHKISSRFEGLWLSSRLFIHSSVYLFIFILFNFFFKCKFVINYLLERSTPGHGPVTVSFSHHSQLQNRCPVYPVCILTRIACITLKTGKCNPHRARCNTQLLCLLFFMSVVHR